jgi:hypothetical protein
MSSSSSNRDNNPGLKRDVDYSSSSSESDTESEKRSRKKMRKEEKKRLKQESKSGKEKKDKKDKKDKKHKKERKNHKESSERSAHSNQSDCPPISEHDAIEMASFRQAVQGKQVLVANEREQASLLHASREDIAASLGLPKGLIRTTIEENSITQKYSRDLFGGDDDNPAKRQVRCQSNRKVIHCFRDYSTCASSPKDVEVMVDAVAEVAFLTKCDLLTTDRVSN